MRINAIIQVRRSAAARCLHGSANALAAAAASTSSTTATLSSDAAAILQCLDSPHASADLLAVHSAAINHRVYNDVVFALRDSDKALAFFHWIASEQSRFKHTGFTIRLMTETMNRMNRREEAQRLSQLWKRQSFPALVVEYSQQGNIAAAMELVREMAGDGSMSLQVLHACLRGLCKAKKLDGVLDFFAEAKKVAAADLRAGVLTYSILVAAFTAARRNDDVYEILREVRRSKVKPDLVLSVAWVLGSVGDGDLDKAVECFKELSEEECVEAGGAECFGCLVRGMYQSDRLDEACELAVKIGCESEDVNSIVGRLLQLGRFDRARELVVEMVSKHGSASVKILTCNILLQNARSIDEALELLEKMDSIDLEPDRVSYTLLIRRLCDSGSVDKAKALLDRVLERGCVPDPRIYDPVVEELCKSGRVCEAQEIVRQAERRRCTSVVTYNSLILGFLKTGLLHRAFKVFRKMTSSGPVPDIYTYNILFEGLNRRGRWKIAHKLLGTMNQEGVLPDVVSYNSLIDGLIEKKRHHRAGELLREMAERGCEPNAVTYTIFLKWFTRAGRFDECLELFQKLLDRKLSPNVYTYNTVISALCKSGRLDQAHRLFGAMLASDCVPNVITYRALIHGLCLKKEVERGVLLLETMRKRGCEPDITCYNSIVAAYCKQGRVDEAYALVEGMPCEGNKVTLRALVRGLCNLQMRSFSEISCDVI